MRFLLLEAFFFLWITLPDLGNTFSFPANHLTYTIRTGKNDVTMKLYPGEVDKQAEIRQWVLMNTKVRPVVSMSTATSLSEMLRDLWEGVLVSYRVLNEDILANTDSQTIAFPRLRWDDSSVQTYLKESFPSLQEDLMTYDGIFQPEVIRGIQFHQATLPRESNPMLLLSIHAKRTQSLLLDLADIDDPLPETLPPDQIVSNAVEGFPFATVFDFISEVNRPADPAIMSNLRFRFRVEELKVQSKRKNNQEVVDKINCRLTRLQNWRDLLENTPDPTPIPYRNLNEWCQHIKAKYRSLKYLVKQDPKRALDTQYNKRSTFIGLIDAWMDRLLRKFKFYQHGRTSLRRERKLELDKALSPWQESLSTLVSLPASVTSLKLHPSYTGNTSNLESKIDRSKMFFREDIFDDVFMNTKKWAQEIVAVQSYAWKGIQDSFILPLDSVSQVTMSKAFIAESAMSDLWSALLAWDKPRDRFAPTATLLTALPKHDHHEEYLNMLRGLNAFVRRESNAKHRGVKSLLQQLQKDGQRASDWWSAVVNDQGLHDRVTALYNHDHPSFTSLIDSFMGGNRGGGALAFSSLRSEKDVSLMRMYSEQWQEQYRETVSKLEELRRIVSSVGSTNSLVRLEKVSLGDGEEGEENIIHISVLPQQTAASERKQDVLLFLLPRFYREINEQLELEKFILLSAFVTRQLNQYQADRGHFQVIPLHPVMRLDPKIPDLSHRCPYPALLVIRSRST
eukprot:gene9538-10542_t